MSDTHKQLKRYIEKLFEMQQRKKADSKKQNLTNTDLKKVATEMGLDDSDWAFIQSEIQDHLTRGLQFTKHGNWDHAIKELKEVISLSPNHKEALMGLAEAYKGRWVHHDKEEDKKEAEKYALLCLEVDPQHEPAYALMGALNDASMINAKGELSERYVRKFFGSFDRQFDLFTKVFTFVWVVIAFIALVTIFMAFVGW